MPSIYGNMITQFSRLSIQFIFIGISNEGRIIGLPLEELCSASQVSSFETLYLFIWYNISTHSDSLCLNNSFAGTEALFADLCHFPVLAIQVGDGMCYLVKQLQSTVSNFTILFSYTRDFLCRLHLLLLCFLAYFWHTLGKQLTLWRIKGMSLMLFIDPFLVSSSRFA